MQTDRGQCALSDGPCLFGALDTLASVFGGVGSAAAVGGDAGLFRFVAGRRRIGCIGLLQIFAELRRMNCQLFRGTLERGLHLQEISAGFIGGGFVLADLALDLRSGGNVLVVRRGFQRHCLLVERPRGVGQLRFRLRRQVDDVLQVGFGLRQLRCPGVLFLDNGLNKLFAERLADLLLQRLARLFGDLIGDLLSPFENRRNDVIGLIAFDDRGQAVKHRCLQIFDNLFEGQRVETFFVLEQLGEFFQFQIEFLKQFVPVQFGHVRIQVVLRQFIVKLPQLFLG